MANKKSRASRLYLQTPANWYREARITERYAEDAGEIAADRPRLKYTQLLKDDIKLLRKYARGFEAKDGYDLHRVVFIPDTKIQKLRYYAKILRREQSQGEEVTKVYRPRSARSVRAMETYTRQTDIPKRKAYRVPVQDVKTHTVKVITRKHVIKDKRGRKIKVKKAAVRVTHRFKGGRSEQDSFFFADYTNTLPVTFDEMEALIKAMLPHLPKGAYVFISNVYGNISVLMDRDEILNEIAAKWMAYDRMPDGETYKDSRGLAETIIGLRRTGSTLEGAMREYHKRLTRRSVMRDYQQAQKSGRQREFNRKYPKLIK